GPVTAGVSASACLHAVPRCAWLPATQEPARLQEKLQSILARYCPYKKTPVQKPAQPVLHNTEKSACSRYWPARTTPAKRPALPAVPTAANPTRAARSRWPG